MRDGANLAVAGLRLRPHVQHLDDHRGVPQPAGRSTSATGAGSPPPPFSEPETFVFPDGIGPVECVNVEHEEVLLVPRWVEADRVTFKYGLGDEFIEVLQVLHRTGLDSTAPVQVGGASVSPRDVVAACLPDPVTLGDRMTGKTCAGTWVTGLGPDGQPREVYLYHVADNEQTMRDYGCQAVVWQTALGPAVALELLAGGRLERRRRARSRGLPGPALPRPAGRPTDRPTGSRTGTAAGGSVAGWPRPRSPMCSSRPARRHPPSW